MYNVTKLNIIPKSTHNVDLALKHSKKKLTEAMIIGRHIDGSVYMHKSAGLALSDVIYYLEQAKYSLLSASTSATYKESKDE